MARTEAERGFEGLLAESGWLRGLARCLVHDGPDADDLVQKTWVAAMRSPPEEGRALRPWLAQVVRNLVRMDARAAGRRRARERAAGEESASERTSRASAETALVRLELQRLVAGLVQELEEPYRTVLVLRFFEGRAPADIAQEQGLPPGTVRWRINEGLERLRRRLDEAHGGRRERWRAALLPIAAGARLASRAGTAAVVAAGVVAAGLAGALFWAAQPSPRPPATSVAAAVRNTQRTQEGQPMNISKQSGTTAAAFFGLALPALVAGADEPRRLTPAETVDFCVEMREKQVPCKEVLADIRASRVAPERREGTRRTIIAEIVADGTGPIAARKAKCATELAMPKAMWIGYLTWADVNALRACNAEKECKTGVACWMNVIEPVVARARKR